ncbi:MAG: hypothetical protein AB7S74_17370 [Hyphomicrobium sp.]
MTTRHFAVNLQGRFEAPATAGFNLADISSVSALDRLPAGMKGVYWLGNGYNTYCNWQKDANSVRKIVTAVKHHPKFSGIYYISDEPHPSVCPDAAEQIKMRTALIHELDPAGKTFMIVLNSSRAPNEFRELGSAADYIGVDPYPCNQRNRDTGCDTAALEARIEAAVAAGISANRIVPVFQTFGQECATTSKPYYRLPTVSETKSMLAIWDRLVPQSERTFDMAYSWGVQERVACPALSSPEAADLRDVYRAYFESAPLRADR